MALIIPINDAWAEQPNILTGKNWNASYGIGLVALVNPGVSLVDQISGAVLSAKNGNPRIRSNVLGVTATCEGLGDAFYGSASPSHYRTGEVSILWVGRSLGPGTDYAGICGITYSATNSSPYVYCELKRGGPGAGTSLNFILSISCGGVPVNTVAQTNISSGAFLSVIGTVKSEEQILYLSNVLPGGIFYTATTSFSGAAVHGSSPQIEIGDSLNARTPATDTNLFAVWNRALTAPEVREILKNPWQILAP